jgi:hypothetical protein
MKMTLFGKTLSSFVIPRVFSSCDFRLHFLRSYEMSIYDDILRINQGRRQIATLWEVVPSAGPLILSLLMWMTGSDLGRQD